ncbi:MAG: hypothetical protein IPL19_23640 [Sandaracinaceae bacterium]|nr:hypothetical protein [Sandaracinaceae bacterium]
MPTRSTNIRSERGTASLANSKLGWARPAPGACRSASVHWGTSPAVKSVCPTQPTGSPRARAERVCPALPAASASSSSRAASASRNHDALSAVIGCSAPVARSACQTRVICARLPAHTWVFPISHGRSCSHVSSTSSPGAG